MPPTPPPLSELASARRLPLPEAELWLVEGFLAPSESAELLALLLERGAWRQDGMRMFGRWVDFPRLHAWYGAAGASYAFSGLRMEPLPFPPFLDELRLRLERACGTAFNSALLNLYRDGADSMAWHADDEPELGREPAIASLSLGAERTFALRPKGGGKAARFALRDGSLLLMAGPTQHHWQHQLPKTRRPVGPRVNLTFRRVFPQSRILETAGPPSGPS